MCQPNRRINGRDHRPPPIASVNVLSPSRLCAYVSIILVPWTRSHILSRLQKGPLGLLCLLRRLSLILPSLLVSCSIALMSFMVSIACNSCCLMLLILGAPWNLPTPCSYSNGCVRTVLDSFTLMGTEGGDHHCHVQKPMWDSWRDLLCRKSAHRFTVELLKPGLKYLFLALDYLHSECKLVHTGTRGESQTVLLF